MLYTYILYIYIIYLFIYFPLYYAGEEATSGHGGQVEGPGGGAGRAGRDHPDVGAGTDEAQENLQPYLNMRYFIFDHKNKATDHKQDTK